MGSSTSFSVSGDLTVPNPEVIATPAISPPTPVPVQLRSDIYGTPRSLEIELPFRTLVKGFIIECLREKYLRSFTLQYAAMDHVEQGVMKDIEFAKGQPLVSVNVDIILNLNKIILLSFSL